MNKNDFSQNLDLTLYQVVPIDLQESFFFELVKNIAKSPAFSNNKALLNSFKQSIYLTLCIEQKSLWVDDFNNQMLELYERLGAGTSISPSQDDKPKRLYKNIKNNMSQLEEILMDVIESLEEIYDFANIIRTNRRLEAEKMANEYREALARMQAKR